MVLKKSSDDGVEKIETLKNQTPKEVKIFIRLQNVNFTVAM